MKTLVLAALLGTLSIVCALEPLPPMQPAPVLLLPQPVLIVQQNGQLVFTDKSPAPVVIVQRQPQLWTTSTGKVLMPLQPKWGEK
ncbi:MAG: hypothetical protein ACOYMS_06085 [Terrimicrobiaceae bacterium]